MSRKNYTKYSQMNKENKEVVDKTSIDTPEIKEEWVVTEEADGVHVRPSVNGEILDTPVEKIITQDELIELEQTQNKELEEALKDETETGVVSGCAKLRVRKAPSADADIYGTIEEDTELTVNINKSTEDFYRVNTMINGTLVSGYCMKKFIKIK